METVQKVNKSTMEIVKDIALDISWQQIAKKYFGKSSSWLYSKLHERDLNKTGTPFKFTESEQEQLKGALCDLANRIRRVADEL